MHTSIAPSSPPMDHLATVTSKGQVTIPASVRQHLNVKRHRRIAFVIQPDGSVSLKAPKYPTLESLTGSIPSPSRSVTIEQMHHVVEEEVVDRYLSKHGK